MANHLSRFQEFSIVRYYGDKAKADAVYAYVSPFLSCVYQIVEDFI